MELLEYQAKELFCEVGIPVLPSQTIAQASDLKQLKLFYPVVLKSQVRAGGRGKSGGVRFVANTIDAIAAARHIFNLSILGEFPKVLLAEAKYDAQQELYLAVVLDYTAKRPVLLGSAYGGIDVETLVENIHQVVVDGEFCPFYARRLMVKMGLEGETINSVSAIMEKMYALFVEKDLDLVEINPLGVSATGKVMALDGKITVNDYALGRHLDLISLGEEEQSPQPSQISWLNQGSNIGIICHGSSLAMATIDSLNIYQAEPSRCFVLDPFTPETAAQQMQTALEELSQIKSVQVVLVNFFGDVDTNEALAQSLITYTENTPASSLLIVMYLGGATIFPSRDRLSTLPVNLVDSLNEAVAKTLDLSDAQASLNMKKKLSSRSRVTKRTGNRNP
ncbi:ATPase [Merismopedia glauca CCAP 1448/3]|uniref:ATPase n=1 Tax=Merismopedia glauca CCAP 1448/3 TaxID=1296344 RepID=A0A2T1C2P3_9CYAN|nr:ATPase [Merismopedia glauca CCAP 1448/3]